jgi:hypothetical protein
MKLWRMYSLVIKSKERFAAGHVDRVVGRPKDWYDGHYLEMKVSEVSTSL